MIENFFQPLAKNFPKPAKNGGNIDSVLKTAEHISSDSIAIFTIGDSFIEIRKAFYKLANHFENTQIVDLGLFSNSKSEKNNLTGIKEVLLNLYEKKCKVLILSSDSKVALAQWSAEKEFRKSSDIALISPSFTSPSTDYLFELWKQKQERKQLFHISLIGLQTYYNRQSAYEQLNSYFYDDMRLGEFRVNPHSVETILRESDFACFDINALKYSDFKARTAHNPNGFYSEESCLLTRYAGISNRLNSMSIVEITPKNMSESDAALVAQMMWYFADGVESRYHDFPNPKNRDFRVMHCPIESSPVPEIVFIKSLISGRLWMQVPFGKELRWIGCTEDEYNIAVQGEVPEKWFRAVGF